MATYTKTLTLNGYKTDIGGTLTCLGRVYGTWGNVFGSGGSIWELDGDVLQIILSGDSDDNLGYTATEHEFFTFTSILKIDNPEDSYYLDVYCSNTESYIDELSTSGEATHTIEMQPGDFIIWNLYATGTPVDGAAAYVLTFPHKSVTLDGFVYDQVTFNGKKFNTYGDALWFENESGKLQSGIIADYQSSTLTYQCVEETEEFSFTVTVSSEQDYDFVRVYLNGVEQVGLSGEDSSTQTLSLIRGDLVVITYSKDESNAVGDDCATFELAGGGEGVLKTFTIDGIILTTPTKTVTIDGIVWTPFATATLDGLISLPSGSLTYDKKTFIVDGMAYWYEEAGKLRSGSFEGEGYSTLQYTAKEKEVVIVSIGVDSLRFYSSGDYEKYPLIIYKNGERLVEFFGGEWARHGYEYGPEYSLYELRPYYAQNDADYYLEDNFRGYGNTDDGGISPTYYIELEPDDILTFDYIQYQVGITIPYEGYYGQKKGWIESIAFYKGDVATIPAMIRGYDTYEEIEKDIYNPNGAINQEGGLTQLTFEELCEGWHNALVPPWLNNGEVGYGDAVNGFVSQAMLEVEVDLPGPVKQIIFNLAIYNNYTDADVETYTVEAYLVDDWGTVYNPYEDFVKGSEISGLTLIATGSTTNIVAEGGPHYDFLPNYYKLAMTTTDAFRQYLNTLVGEGPRTIKIGIFFSNQRTYDTTYNGGTFHLDRNTELVMLTGGRVIVGGPVIRGSIYGGKYSRR